MHTLEQCKRQKFSVSNAAAARNGTIARHKAAIRRTYNLSFW